MHSIKRQEMINSYDLIVIGGALSGSATALLAKQMCPQMRILIIERNAMFKRRVGESTVEISSYFLGKVLDLSDYLLENHLIKQGLRFWFHNDKGLCPDSCSEIGPHYNVRLASYQVDRAKLDEHLLEICRTKDIEVLRPAEVKAVNLQPGGEQEIQVRKDGVTLNFMSRWVVDASGVARILARKNGWIQRNEEHPISSAWARWRGVKSWDSKELHQRYPEYAKRCFALRNTATNHLIGMGWWSWWIPLKGGDVSVGVVYDERLTQPPEGDKPADRLRGLLCTHPMAKVFLEEAECLEKDVHWRRNLSYCSKNIIGDGFALVGDAAGFIDPFYSPGMDWVSFTAYNAASLIARERKNEIKAEEYAAKNSLLTGSYYRWFRAIYKDKYYYMGDWELMKLAFRLDLGLYYLGVVSQPYKHGEESFESAPLNGPHTGFPTWLISFYNRRLAAIGKRRMKIGTWGRRNNGAYFPFVSYTLDGQLIWRLLKALLAWGRLELVEGYRTWWK
jgi:flavin-dependent dehydrogenase